MTPIEALMDELGVEYRLDRTGGQSVLCPYHDDSRPSASLDIGQGLFYCFTCGVGGDAIALLRDERDMTYAAAVAFLQGLVGDDDAQVSRKPAGERGDSFLPRRSAARPGHRAWKSPWAGH